MGKAKCLLCSNASWKTFKLSFHKFPTNEIRREKWLKAIGKPEYVPRKWDVICADHFEKGQIITGNGGAAHYLIGTACPSPRLCQIGSSVDHARRLNRVSKFENDKNDFNVSQSENSHSLFNINTKQMSALSHNVYQRRIQNSMSSACPSISNDDVEFTDYKELLLEDKNGTYRENINNLLEIQMVSNESDSDSSHFSEDDRKMHENK